MTILFDHYISYTVKAILYMEILVFIKSNSWQIVTTFQGLMKNSAQSPISLRVNPGKNLKIKRL